MGAKERGSSRLEARALAGDKRGVIKEVILGGDFNHQAPPYQTSSLRQAFSSSPGAELACLFLDLGVDPFRPRKMAWGASEESLFLVSLRAGRWDLATLILDRLNPVSIARDEISEASGAISLSRLGACVESSTLVARLAHLGVDFNSPDLETRTPLHWLSHQNSPTAIEALDILLAAGAFIDFKTRSGLTPLMLAARHGKIGLAQALLNRGADPAATDGSAKNCLFHFFSGLVSSGAELSEPEARQAIRLFRDRGVSCEPSDFDQLASDKSLDFDRVAASRALWEKTEMEAVAPNASATIRSARLRL